MRYSSVPFLRGLFCREMDLWSLAGVLACRWVASWLSIGSYGIYSLQMVTFDVGCSGTSLSYTLAGEEGLVSGLRVKGESSLMVSIVSAYTVSNIDAFFAYLTIGGISDAFLLLFFYTYGRVGYSGCFCWLLVLLPYLSPVYSLFLLGTYTTLYPADSNTVFRFEFDLSLMGLDDFTGMGGCTAASFAVWFYGYLGFGGTAGASFLCYLCSAAAPFWCLVIFTSFLALLSYSRLEFSLRFLTTVGTYSFICSYLCSFMLYSYEETNFLRAVDFLSRSLSCLLLSEL